MSLIDSVLSGMFQGICRVTERVRIGCTFKKLARRENDLASSLGFELAARVILDDAIVNHPFYIEASR